MPPSHARRIGVAQAALPCMLLFMCTVPGTAAPPQPPDEGAPVLPTNIDGPSLDSPRADVNDCTATIDAIFAEYESASSPGCAVGVLDRGKVILRRGYGSARSFRSTRGARAGAGMIDPLACWPTASAASGP